MGTLIGIKYKTKKFWECSTVRCEKILRTALKIQKVWEIIMGVIKMEYGKVKYSKKQSIAKKKKIYSIYIRMMSLGCVSEEAGRL